MAGKVEARKTALREKLIEAAELRIDRDGVASLRARDLAADAGCSVGAIYNVVEDLNALVMQVNGRTFRKIGEKVGASVDPSLPPNAQMIALSMAYLHFARDNKLLWQALFDLEMSTNSAVPQWYLAELEQLFAYIAAPLAKLFPEMDRAALGLMTRALFSSVHGIVLLGLEQRISGVPVEQIEKMIAAVLSQIGNK